MKCNILLNMLIVRSEIVLIRVLTKLFKHASYQRLCCELVGLWNCKFTEDVINCTLTIKLVIPFTDQDCGHIPRKFLGLTGVSLH